MYVLIAFSDIGKVISKAVAQVDKEVRNFIHQLVEQVKNLPVYGMLREKWEEVSVVFFYFT